MIRERQLCYKGGPFCNLLASLPKLFPYHWTFREVLGNANFRGAVTLDVCFYKSAFMEALWSSNILMVATTSTRPAHHNASGGLYRKEGNSGSAVKKAHNTWGVTIRVYCGLMSSVNAGHCWVYCPLCSSSHPFLLLSASGTCWQSQWSISSLSIATQ